MVKGKTKSGIKFQIDERIKDDARFLFYLNQLNKADDPQSAYGNAMDMIGLIFGGGEGTIAFMNEVAAKHGGVCEVTTMVEEIKEIVQATKLKNSSPSPK